MTGRPRKASDDEVYGAALRVMARRGPAEITLADIAVETGLTAGALVQRFGSKRGLLLSLMERFAGSAPAMFQSLRAAAKTPLGAIRAYGDCMGRLGRTPDELVRQLAWLHHDLADPDFRRLLLAQARATRRELRRLVREAVEEGELVREVDTGLLARAIEVTVSGSLMTWAMYQEGDGVAWVRRNLEMSLLPWKPPPETRKRG